MRVPALDKAWAGIDVGKRHHWICVVEQDGRQLLSVRVANDEAEIGAVIGSVTGLAGEEPASCRDPARTRSGTSGLPAVVGAVATTAGRPG